MILQPRSQDLSSPFPLGRERESGLEKEGAWEQDLMQTTIFTIDEVKQNPKKCNSFCCLFKTNIFAHYY